jgi:lycopene cyclase domain-containing protein
MTNAILNVGVLGALFAVSVPVLRRVRAWPVVCTVVHLVLLTAVFDTIMIDVGLYEYATDKILGIYVWRAPLEDFAYPVAAAVGMPVLWTVLERRRARRAADPGPAPATPAPSAAPGPDPRDGTPA